MINIILKILALLVILLGVILLYDARAITKQFFAFGDQNEGTTGLKILGMLLTLVGGVALFFIQM